MSEKLLIGLEVLQVWTIIPKLKPCYKSWGNKKFDENVIN
jgi:hypothetical protein